MNILKSLLLRALRITSTTDNRVDPDTTVMTKREQTAFTDQRIVMYAHMLKNKSLEEICVALAYRDLTNEITKRETE